MKTTIETPKTGGGARVLQKSSSGEKLYRTFSTRVTTYERELIKNYVKRKGGYYSSVEDFLENVAFQFIMERPYAKGGMNFYFPRSTTAPARGTDEVRRTGWVQLNFYLHYDLAEAVKAEVLALQKLNPNVSQAAYLYTGLRWALSKGV